MADLAPRRPPFSVIFSSPSVVSILFPFSHPDTEPHADGYTDPNSNSDTDSDATVPDSAAVYQTLGADNAINIDGGGSTALWLNGSYIYGPERAIPTAILFVR